MEVAGLVVAVLPIVCKGLNHWRRHCSELNTYQGFQFRFDELRVRVSIEIMEYKCILFYVLSPIVDDDDILRSLIEDGDSRYWKHEDLNRQLTSRLGDKTDSFETLISLMYKVVVDLQRKLRIKNGQIVDPEQNQHRVRALKKVMRKLNFDGHDSRIERVERMREYNGLLARLVGYEKGSANELDSRAVLKLERFRQQARSLHRHLSCHFEACRYRRCATHHALLSLPAVIDWQQPTVLIITEALGPDLIAAGAKAVPVELLQESSPFPRTIDDADTDDGPDLRNPSETCSAVRRDNHLCLSIKREVDFVDHGGWKLPDSEGRDRLRIASDELNATEAELNDCLQLRRLFAEAPYHWLNQRSELRFNTIHRLTMSVLTIVRSPWIHDDWSVEDLLLSCHDDHPRYNWLFVSKEFRGLSGENHAPVSEILSGSKLRRLLFSLGLAILQILFAQKIEVDPKLWSAGVEPQPRSQSRNRKMNCWDWIDRVERRYGHQVSGAVRRCLMSAFDPALDLAKRDFREAFFKKVIEPLRNWDQTWPV